MQRTARRPLLVPPPSKQTVRPFFSFSRLFLSSLTAYQRALFAHILVSDFVHAAPPTPPSADSQAVAASPEESTNSAQFVTRVSGLPIVTTALRAYEQSKASSRVVKVRLYIS